MVDKRYLIGIKLDQENHMSLPTTETLPERDAIDTLDALTAVCAIVDSQRSAAQSIKQSAHSIVSGANLMAEAVSKNGTLIYAAAGSSGLMALADASELTGTFGIPSAQIQLHMAGGVPTNAEMPGHTEDLTDAISFSGSDVAIILSASGTTPYAQSICDQAKEAGAKVIAIANNPNTKLLENADVPILLNTPPEVIAGSTRLGAATAQKTTLNALSTMMGIKLGHVYQGRMVNLIADNKKLLQRAENIVCEIARVSPKIAQGALNAAQGSVKAAILVASGHSPKEAETLLEQHKGQLGPCLNQTNQTE